MTLSQLANVCKFACSQQALLLLAAGATDGDFDDIVHVLLKWRNTYSIKVQQGTRCQVSVIRAYIMMND